jgi:DUF1016 N-terminal domain
MKSTFENLLAKISSINVTLQTEAIRSVSKSLTLRNWLIGYSIVEYEQNGEDRASYGDKIIENLAKKLDHIQGVSQTNLKLFRQFYLAYPQIQQTAPVESVSVDIFRLLNSCSFSHFIELIKLDDQTKRLFYEVETIKGRH